MQEHAVCRTVAVSLSRLDHRCSTAEGDDVVVETDFVTWRAYFQATVVVQADSG